MGVMLGVPLLVVPPATLVKTEAAYGAVPTYVHPGPGNVPPPLPIKLA